MKTAWIMNCTPPIFTPSTQRDKDLKKILWKIVGVVRFPFTVSCISDDTIRHVFLDTKHFEIGLFFLFLKSCILRGCSVFTWHAATPFDYKANPFITSKNNPFAIYKTFVSFKCVGKTNVNDENLMILYSVL